MMLNIGISEIIMIIIIFCLFVNTDELPKVALKISRIFFEFKKYASDLQFLIINNIQEIKKINDENLDIIDKEKSKPIENIEDTDKL